MRRTGGRGTNEADPRGGLLTDPNMDPHFLATLTRIGVNKQAYKPPLDMIRHAYYAKYRGQGADGTNRYRLLFSLWNSSTLNYVSWQHMSTPLVVRNSFHMLPLEEKNYRRQQQYSRSRGRSTDALVPGAGASEMVVNNHVHYAGPMSAPKCPSHQELLTATLGLL